MSLTLYPLGDYIQLLQRKNLQLEFSGAPLTREVSLVSCDSRQVVPGTLFICKGAHFKVEFLQSAKEQGAFAYLSEKRYDQVDLPCILVSDVRLAMALLADFYYNHPSAKLGVVGITGTKGKSSTAYYLKYIFDEYLAAKGQPASGVISSIETYDGVEKFESHLTTPEPLDLERHFANGVATGMRYLTMEVSSQALKYDRVKNVEFAAAVFLNIGMDHISPIEHPDFEDYFASKLRIFSQAAPEELPENDYLLPEGPFGHHLRLPGPQSGGRHPFPGQDPPVQPGVPADHARPVQCPERPGRPGGVRGGGGAGAVRLRGSDEGPGPRTDGGLRQRR